MITVSLCLRLGDRQWTIPHVDITVALGVGFIIGMVALMLATT